MDKEPEAEAVQMAEHLVAVMAEQDDEVVDSEPVGDDVGLDCELGSPDGFEAGGFDGFGESELVSAWRERNKLVIASSPPLMMLDRMSDSVWIAHLTALNIAVKRLPPEHWFVELVPLLPLPPPPLILPKKSMKSLDAWLIALMA